MITGLILLGMGLVLAGPGSVWVSRWSFLYDVPRAGVLLWQAGAVAALLSVSAAGVVWLLDLLPRDDQALWRVGLAVLGLSFSAQVLIRGLWALSRVGWQTAERRRRHRARVDVLAETRELPTGARLAVLAQQVPVAYCLPGVRGSRVVVSEGTVASLDQAEFDAVLAHEQAHLRARHDVVLDTFTALHQAFPLVVRSHLPKDRCRVLIEMLADDAAAARVGRLPLARALAKLSQAPVPDGGLGVGAEAVLRVQRLAGRPQRPRLTAALVMVLAVGLVALPVAILILGWLSAR